MIRNEVSKLFKRSCYLWVWLLIPSSVSTQTHGRQLSSVLLMRSSHLEHIWVIFCLISSLVIAMIISALLGDLFSSLCLYQKSTGFIFYWNMCIIFYSSRMQMHWCIPMLFMTKQALLKSQVLNMCGYIRLQSIKIVNIIFQNRIE